MWPIFSKSAVPHEALTLGWGVFARGHLPILTVAFKE